MSVSGTTKANIYYDALANTYNSNGAVQINNLSTASPNTLLNSSGNGYVGIGFTTPQQVLSVECPTGNYTNAEHNPHSISALTGTTTSDYMLYMGADKTNNLSYIQSVRYGTAVANLVLNARGGNVGINTPSPSYPLDVVNAMRVTTTGVGSAGVTVSGGTISTNGSNTIVTFYSSGSITFPSSGTVSILAVGGGGGGGGNGGGGGGGGGVVYNASVTVSGMVSAVIAAGGAGNTSIANIGGTGGVTTFGSVTATGGGGGGTRPSSGTLAGSAGACGGGATSNGGRGTGSPGGSGGTSPDNGCSTGGGGGGGMGATGTGAAGVNGVSGQGGTGGTGVLASYYNVAFPATTFGGGGGGITCTGSGNAGLGSGGGGGGGSANMGGNGAAGCGGGGGGGISGGATFTGGAGGSGAVIVSFPTSSFPGSETTLIATSGGQVGIGTGSPSATLEVDGTASISSWASQSMTGNGYARMGGLLIQWGKAPYNNNLSETVTFPTAFATLFSVTATVDAGTNAGSGANTAVKVYNCSPSNFQYGGVGAFSGDNVSNIRWIAIGN
jgi:hypothetical protein